MYNKGTRQVQVRYRKHTIASMLACQTIADYESEVVIMNDNVNNEATNDLIAGIMERQVKRLFVLCVALVIALLASNIGWLVYESQFDKVVITQDGDVGGDGDVKLSGVGSGEVYNYAESEPDNQNEGSQRE